jgi:hypothetical protein
MKTNIHGDNKINMAVSLAKGKALVIGIFSELCSVKRRH